MCATSNRGCSLKHAFATFLLLLALAGSCAAPLLLSGCDWSQAALCEAAYVPSPTMTCNGAPVHFSTYNSGSSAGALYRTADGAWQLAYTCTTRAACFADGVCNSAAEINALSCSAFARPACAPAATPLAVSAPNAGADPAAFTSLGALNVSAVLLEPGFACAPTNDPSQCAALAAAYADMGGAGWVQSSGWRAAVAGVPTDYCSFLGVLCEAAPTSTPAAVSCPPYSASDTNSGLNANAVTCDLALAPGYSYEFTTCVLNATGPPNGDGTVLRVNDIRGMEMAHSNAIGGCSLLKLYVPWQVGAPLSRHLVLVQGCGGSGACNGAVRVNVNAGPLKVERLALYGNNMVGIISPALGRLPTLTYLNLGGNYLRGSISGAMLALLTNLTELDVGTNYLTGSVPAELASLPLERLALNTLSLSGTLPAQLANLTGLKSLSLRCSGLCGRLPVGSNVALDFKTQYCEGTSCKEITEFLPSCDCELYMASTHSWYCSDKHSPWGVMVFTFGSVWVLTILRPIWRGLVRITRLGACSAAARRAGCGSLADLIREQSHEEAAVRRFMRGVEMQAATQPGGSVFDQITESELLDVEPGYVAPASPSTPVAQVSQLSGGMLQRSSSRPSRRLPPGVIVSTLGGRFSKALYRAALPGSAPQAISLARVNAVVRAEIIRLAGMHHPNVFTPRGILEGSDVVVFPELATALGTLSDFVTSTRHTGYHTLLRLATEVSTGLAYMHMPSVAAVHCSLCASNCIVFQSFPGEAGINARIITLTQPLEWQWRAPELLRGTAVAPTKESDVYAMAVTLWEIFHGSCDPLPDLNDSVLEQRIAAVTDRGLRPQLHASIPTELKLLITNCWLESAAERMQANELACKLGRQQFLAANKPRASSMGTGVAVSQDPEPELDADELIQVTVVDANLPKCPTHGISLAGLKLFRAAKAGKIFEASAEELDEWNKQQVGECPGPAVFESLTTAQVVSRIIKPDTAASRLSYADQLDAKSEDGLPLVAPANVFISHAWSNLFSDLADAILSKLDNKPDSHAVYIWNDIFVSSQHTAAALPTAWWTDAFAKAVSTINRTLLILQPPWDSPVPLTRSWCLWEIFSTTHAISAAPTTSLDAADCALNWRGLNVALAPEHEKLFLEALVNDVSGMKLALRKIDASTAQAFKASDRRLIYQVVATSPGGFAYVNSVVRESLLHWVARCVKAALAQAKKRDVDVGGMPTLDTLKLYHSLIKLYIAEGNPEDMFNVPEDLLDDADIAAMELQLALGKHSQPARYFKLPFCCSEPLPSSELSDSEMQLLEVWQLRSFFLSHYMYCEYEAMVLQRRVLKTKLACSAFGPTHESTLQSYADLADAMQAVLDSMPGGGFLKFFEFSCEYIGGPWMVDRLLRPGCTATLSFFQITSDSRTATVLETCVGLLFCFFPLNFLLLVSFGCNWLFYRAQIDALHLKAANAQLQADALPLRETQPAVLSPEQVRAIEMARSGLAEAVVFLRRKRYLRAEDTCRQALPELNKHLGPQHPESLKAMLLLANLLRKQGRWSTVLLRYGPFNRRVFALLFSRSARAAKFAEAEGLLREALLVCRNQLSNTHSTTLDFIEELAMCLQWQAIELPDRVELAVEAQSLLAGAAESLRATLGAEHPATVACARAVKKLRTMHVDKGMFNSAWFQFRCFIVSFLALSAITLASYGLIVSKSLHDPLFPLEGRLPACPVPDW